MGMNNETKNPETGNDYLKKVAEMDFEKIQKSELTYDEAVTEFKKCNRFICKNLLGWLFSPEEETMLNMEYAKELKKLVDKANEKPEPEETSKRKAKVELDFYIRQCATKSLSFMMKLGSKKLASAMVAGYASALVDVGVIEDTKEDRENFINAVMEKMLILSLLK